MARRKQQNPRHLESSHDLAASLQNGISSSSDSEDDEHVCGKCRAEFPSLSDFLKHKQACVSKRPVLLLDNGKSIHGDDDNDSEDLPPPRLTAALDPPPVQNGLFLFPKNYSPKVSDLSQLVQRLSDTNVTLEELRNTTVAVAQHGRLLQETHLAALLSNIHQQQVAQLHVIQELQTQILGAQDTSNKVVPLVGTAALTPPQSGSDSAMGAAPPNGAQPSAPTSARTSTTSKTVQADVSDERQTGIPIYEPNTLELLQRHTEQALQNTMSGGSFLLNTVGNSSELAKLKRTKDGKIDEAASRHRCKFCGKVFGSDSSLQIHIRSHTGERPFKCSVCNSCFSTKGNLKVHFQRHKENLEVPADLQINDNHSSSVASNVFDQVQPTNDQALDFSTSLNGKTTPSNEQQIGSRSRSATPNDISNLSDDSIDPSDHCGENVNNPLALDDRHFDEEDDDDNDDDRGSNSSAMNNLDDDFDNNLQQLDPHSFTFASPTFTPFFRPISFGASLSDGNSVCLPSTLVPPPTSQSNQDSHMHHQDPQAYQDLLPRIGSNDNSWESLMEVTDTSETSKLQKLVDKIEVLDPNQCGFCHRVLSCKSALLMHYRTHTGERPFRCKICGRAFTTKGNLKTHMSVHRHKPPSRVLHQCPVCHKQFANSVILQQHIRMHTGGNAIILQDPIFYRDEESPTLLPPSYPRPMLMPSQLATNSEPLALVNNDSRRQTNDSQQSKNPDTVIKTTITDLQPSGLPSSPTASSSSSQSSPQTPSIAEPISHDEVKSALFEKCDDDGVANKSGHASPTNPGILKPPTPIIQEKELSPKSDYDRIITHNNLVNNLKITIEGQGIEKRPENSVEHVEKPKSIQNQHPIVSIANDKPLPMTLPSDCPIPLNLNSEKHMLSLNIPSTTSDYTASLAALENHVKAINSSTTNPLPFPPTLGLGFSMPNYYRSEYNLPTYHSKDKMRSFSPPNGKVSSDVSADERSTPGSVIKGESPKAVAPARSESGALDLTPRGTSSSTTPQRLPIDLKMFTPLAGLPFASPHLARLGTTCQICFKTFACQSALEIHYRSHTKERPFKCEVCDRGFSTKGNMKQHMLTHKIRDLPAKLFTSTLSQSPNTQSSTTSPSSPSTPLPMQTTESPIFSIAPSVPKKFEEISVKRPSNDGNHPHPPKRSPGVPKHVCEVCHKPFSSGSALQIHMRTHTGIKPFQCNICSRAFTTKGNLKVHMGTHLSSNGTSRRGRRMSLDLPPLSLPLGKHGEYPPPRHDMFFPYLPPFINGMSRPFPPPKMNEISVIQSAGGRDDTDSSAITSRAMVMPPPNVSLGINVSRPLALVTTSHNSKSNISPQKGEDLAGKSPTRKRDLFSPISRGPDAIQMVERNASWSWKIACNYCNKICSSSVELELHINKEHTKTEQRENHETVVSET